MKNFFVLLATGFISLFSFAQKIDKIINVAEVKRIESVLASDDMQGRKAFTAGIDKAASFIEEEFRKSKLSFWGGLTSYRQTFSQIRTKFLEAGGTINNEPAEAKNIIAITTQPLLNITDTSGYEAVHIAKEDDLNKQSALFAESGKNQVVWVDAAHSKNFGRLTRLKRELTKKPTSTIFILNTKGAPLSNYNLTIKHEITDMPLTNIVGIIPGKSRPEEMVIFSSHYDHLGIGKPNAEQDSIFNGANDDAAGTTAVIMLAKYFAAQKTMPERTLVFVAFTAEEIGGFGSRYFSRQINADKAIAMLNIEMIGTESKWGTNSAYITGYEKSDLGKILQQNLSGSKFKFEPDPYPSQNLFYRSDNATLAALGVPAHTISTSKMDSEPFYHTQNDELETLDMKNMAEIIKAIAISAKGIIEGKQTPSRVEKMN